MLYFVIYWINGSPSIGGPYATEDQATDAYNWFQTLDGCTYVQMVSISTTSVESWGTPPA